MQPYTYIRELLKNYYLLVVLIVPALFFILIYLVCFNKPDLILYPSENIQIASYSDKVFNGNTQIQSLKDSDNGITLRYTLQNKYPFPYAGFSFSTPSTDISAYNTLTLNASGNNIQKFNIFLLTKEERVKDSTHSLALRHSLQELILGPQPQIFDIPFKESVSPDWWFSAFNFIQHDFPEPDWKQFRGFSFSSGLNPLLNKESSFTIHSLRFYRDNTRIIVIYFIIHVLLLLIAFLFRMYYRRKQDHPLPVTIEYKALSVEDKTENAENFLDYIHRNFDDSELTLSKVSEKTGIPQRKISETIAERFDMNVKTYINQIRINEAQRLLKESGLNSSEVGYKVGFNSPSNFNRVFKSLTGKSPSEYLHDTDN